MIASAMNGLRQRFIDRIAGLHPQISDHLETLRTAENADDAVQALLVDVHRIAGLAGSFGFGVMGSRAAEAELALREAQTGGMSDAARERAAAPLTLLLKEIEQALDSQPECADQLR